MTGVHQNAYTRLKDCADRNRDNHKKVILVNDHAWSFSARLKPLKRRLEAFGFSVIDALAEAETINKTDARKALTSAINTNSTVCSPVTLIGHGTGARIVENFACDPKWEGRIQSAIALDPRDHDNVSLPKPLDTLTCPLTVLSNSVSRWKNQRKLYQEYDYDGYIDIIIDTTQGDIAYQGPSGFLINPAIAAMIVQLAYEPDKAPSIINESHILHQDFCPKPVIS